jgi:hypothetical protein
MQPGVDFSPQTLLTLCKEDGNDSWNQQIHGKEDGNFLSLLSQFFWAPTDV